MLYPKFRRNQPPASKTNHAQMGLLFVVVVIGSPKNTLFFTFIIVNIATKSYGSFLVGAVFGKKVLSNAMRILSKIITFIIVEMLLN